MDERKYEAAIRIEYEKAQHAVEVCRKHLQKNDGKESAYYLIALRLLVKFESVAKIKAYEAILSDKHVPLIDVMIGGIIQMKTDLQKESGIDWRDIYHHVRLY